MTEQLEQELSSLAEGHLLGNICPHIAPHIPESIRQDALEHPNHYFGWALLTDPNKPESPFNTRRTWLSLRNPSTPYSPSNDLLWKTGCP